MYVTIVVLCVNNCEAMAIVIICISYIPGARDVSDLKNKGRVL